MNERSNLTDTADLDRRLRGYVYSKLIAGNAMPLARDVARDLDLDDEEVRDAYRRMKEAHVLVLQEGDTEILMASPFSAVPTPFVVQIRTNSWWGNCIWDAMGIAAMVKGDARISTGCGDCNDVMVLLVEDGSLRLEHGDGIVHFSVPARRWWDNIKFT